MSTRVTQDYSIHSFLPLIDEASISLAEGREGLSESLVGVTMGDEVMVFLSLRCLRKALSLLLEECVWCVSVESL